MCQSETNEGALNDISFKATIIYSYLPAEIYYEDKEGRFHFRVLIIKYYKRRIPGNLLVAIKQKKPIDKIAYFGSVFQPLHN